MKILNLYAGIGGNRKLWGDDHKITAVESEKYIADVYKVLYPNDKVVVGDAHQYLLEHHKEYDFIWSSPPCQSHSRTNLFLNKKGIIRYPDMKLYEEILFLQQFAFDSKWVVENVFPYYKPLIAPTANLHRHLLWSNANINDSVEFNGGVLQDHNISSLQDLHGIVLPGRTKDKRKLLRNAVLPEMGAYIFKEVFDE